MQHLSFNSAVICFFPLTLKKKVWILNTASWDTFHMWQEHMEAGCWRCVNDVKPVKTKQKGETCSDTSPGKLLPRYSCDCHIAQSPHRQCKPGRTSDAVLVARCVEGNWNPCRQITIMRALVITPPPHLHPAAAAAAASWDWGLYKSLHSPFSQHGGRSTSQVSDCTSHHAETHLKEVFLFSHVIYCLFLYAELLTTLFCQ